MPTQPPSQQRRAGNTGNLTRRTTAIIVRIERLTSEARPEDFARIREAVSAKETEVAA